MRIIVPYLGTKFRLKVLFIFREKLEKRKRGFQSVPSHVVMIVIALKSRSKKIFLLLNGVAHSFIFNFPVQLYFQGYSFYQIIQIYEKTFSGVIPDAILGVKSDKFDRYIGQNRYVMGCLFFQGAWSTFLCGNFEIYIYFCT